MMATTLSSDWPKFPTTNVEVAHFPAGYWYSQFDNAKASRGAQFIGITCGG